MTAIGEFEVACSGLGHRIYHLYRIHVLDPDSWFGTNSLDFLKCIRNWVYFHWLGFGSSKTDGGGVIFWIFCFHLILKVLAMFFIGSK